MPESGSILPPGAALVAGGAGGLGSAISLKLARLGANVVVGYRSDTASAEQVVKEIRAAGGAAEALQFDLTDETSTSVAVKKASEIGNGIGTVVYASGPKAQFGFFSATPLAEWQRVITADLLGLVTLAGQVIPYLRKSKGSLVTITTYQGRRIEIKGALSAVPKAAADRLIANIAKEEARYGVRANSVQAGWFEVGGGVRAQAMDMRGVNIPLGRMGHAEELANAVAFLASNQASFITGVNLPVDGGQSL